jgi:hypothetical protein
MASLQEMKSIAIICARPSDRHPTVSVITAHMIIIRHDGGEIIAWSINTKKNRSPTNRTGPWSLDDHKQWNGEGLTTEPAFPPLTL